LKAVQHRVVRLEETRSTNQDAMRLALAGEPLPLWVVAERQTEGKGRAGRSWSSLRGNLHGSLAVLCAASPSRAGEVSLVAGISLIDAVRSSTSLAQTGALRLKWPNDLLIDIAKAGGILVESTTARGEPGFLAVIGFGVNVASAPDDLGRAATSLAQFDAHATSERVLDALVDQSARWLQVWDNGNGFAQVRAAWIARAGPIGEAVAVNTERGAITGHYRGLSSAGGLLVDIDGEIREITYGDVALAVAPREGR